MREIKFRFFDTTSRKMYGMSNIQDYSLEQLHRFASTDDPYTKVMQFTGLTDKDGADIYEGDIIHYEGYGDYIVSWYDECGCWDTELIGPCHEMYMSTNLFEYSESTTQHEAKVIGNIYETRSF